MQRTRWSLMGLAALATLAASPAAEQSSDDVTLKNVSYAELGQLVRGLRGKVVVVDFWAHY